MENVEIVRGHIIINMPNGDYYKIKPSENGITINLQSDEGTLFIKPNVSNDVVLTSMIINHKL